jgi:RimJ/RimL family protein N-acetyltransferase
MIIRTKNFILRPYRMSDAQGITEAINDKIIARNTLTIPYPYKLKDAKWWLGLRKKDAISFCIEINGKVAGSIGLHKISKGHKAEIGYWLGEKYRGRGVMTKAVKEMVKFGFRELKLKRIFGHVFLFNKASATVLKKNGFKFEGVLKKEARKKSGEILDVYLFAKIK